MASFIAFATDPNPLQDFCVATKDPNNADGSANFGLSPARLPGLNTLGIGIGRIHYAPKGGLVPLHVHHRASEVLTLLEGTLYAGFITSIDTGYKLHAKVISAGDVIVYPQGLVHFGYNIGDTEVVAIAAFGSENAGNIRVANAVFSTDPSIRADIISKSFQLDEKIVEEIQSKIFLGLNR